MAATCNPNHSSRVNTNMKSADSTCDPNGKRAENETDKTTTHDDNGFQYYPERRAQKDKSLAEKVFSNHGRIAIQKMRCEQMVYSCTQNSPLVKLMLSAMKTAGCEVDLGRHISCEMCSSEVVGGYDPELNQVVVCQNMATGKGEVLSALSHEFLHMFDYCRANFDARNLEHLACAEIRAANLLHCSFLSSVVNGTSSPFNIAKTHQECVKSFAVKSVLSVRNVTEEAAKAAVNKVFEKCYNDLEPVGRRLRRNSNDMENAYREQHHYNYVD